MHTVNELDWSLNCSDLRDKDDNQATAYLQDSGSPVPTVISLTQLSRLILSA
jgi:hypothetical protein